MAWPVAGGVPERTDQGVDEGVTPGATVTDNVPGTSRFLGALVPNWYNGQQLYGFQVTSGPFKGRLWYIAEQVRSRLGIGSSVSEGSQIGTVPASGTGIEEGWLGNKSGATLAQTTTGYTEGQATPAGASFRSQIINGRRYVGLVAGPPGTSTIAQLWINAGGSPRMANLMAAIAMAESSGNPGEVNSSSKATGLWQIEPATWAQYSGGLPFSDATNPADNAKVAVAVLKGQGLGAWATYTSGAYKQFISGASKDQVNYGGANGGRVRPGGASAQTDAAQSDIFSSYRDLLDTPRSSPNRSGENVMQSFNWYLTDFQQRSSKVFGGS